MPDSQSGSILGLRAKVLEFIAPHNFDMGNIGLYSIVNALMFCFVAGAMISVAATAVGLPLGMPMPQLTDVYPASITWVIVVQKSSPESEEFCAMPR